MQMMMGFCLLLHLEKSLKHGWQVLELLSFP